MRQRSSTDGVCIGGTFMHSYGYGPVTCQAFQARGEHTLNNLSRAFFWDLTPPPPKIYFSQPIFFLRISCGTCTETPIKMYVPFQKRRGWTFHFVWHATLDGQLHTCGTVAFWNRCFHATPSTFPQSSVALSSPQPASQPAWVSDSS